MRRLDLFPRKKYRGESRRYRAFRSCLGSIAKLEFRPEADNQNYTNWKIPAYEKSFTGNRRVANKWLESWIEFGIQWLSNQNDRYISSVITSLPSEFSSEYCTFFNIEYFESFIVRDNEWQKWELVQDVKLPPFMQKYDLSGNYLLIFNETMTDGEDGIIYKGKQYLLCNNLPNKSMQRTFGR